MTLPLVKSRGKYQERVNRYGGRTNREMDMVDGRSASYRDANIRSDFHRTLPTVAVDSSHYGESNRFMRGKVATTTDRYKNMNSENLMHKIRQQAE